METILWWLVWAGAGGCAFVDQSDGGSLLVVAGRQQAEWPAPLEEGAWLCTEGSRRTAPRPRSSRRELPDGITLDELRRTPDEP
jgi:hypothetical protein